MLDGNLPTSVGQPSIYICLATSPRFAPKMHEESNNSSLDLSLDKTKCQVSVQSGSCIFDRCLEDAAVRNVYLS